MIARRLAGWTVLGGLVAVLASFALAPMPAPAPTSVVRPAPGTMQLVRFGGTGFHFGGRKLGSRPRTSVFGRRATTPSRSRGLLRRIGRALAFAAILHFLFAGTSGLGFLFLLILIVGLVVLVSRGRRRRAYRPRW